MSKKILTAGVLMMTLTGCVAEPGYAPYYGGSAPYYGTTYAPAYVGIYGGGYYQHYGYHAIHSGYNDGYWRYQHAQAAGHGGHAPAAAFHGGGAPHAGAAAGGGHEGGEGGHH